MSIISDYGAVGRGRVVHDAGVYDHNSEAYRRGVRQLEEWHRQCAIRRAMAERTKEARGERVYGDQV